MRKLGKCVRAPLLSRGLVMNKGTPTAPTAFLGGLGGGGSLGGCLARSLQDDIPINFSGEEIFQ